MHSIILLCTIVVAYTFTVHTDVDAIPWPFQIVGEGNWTPEKLVLGAVPARGTTDDIDILGTATDSVSFKQIHLLVKLNGAFLHSRTIPYTNSYDAGDTVEFGFKNQIPGFAPSGSYYLELDFFDTQDQPQSGISFQFKL